MPKCVACNIRYKTSQLDANRFCRACLSEMEKKSERQLKDNLVTLCEGRGKDEFQRIFDAFVRTYPEALITGVGCNSECHHLLVYLDEKPMYFATFDPLKNSVNLEPYNKPAAASSPKMDYNAALADRAHTLASAMSFFSLIGALIAFLFSGAPISSLFFGIFSFVALIGCLKDSGNSVVFAGILMALCGVMGDSFFTLPALLVIYGGMKF